MIDHAAKQLIAVLADDLTGAADTGVQFLRANTSAYLLAESELDTIVFDGLDILSVYTRSRHMEARAAADIAGKTATRLARRNPALLYRKLDSCLRGNIAEELDAIVDALQARVCFLAPAFPDQGRTTIHGIHLLQGVPLAETEMARDPITPVSDSDLAVFFAGRSKYSVGRIDMDDYTQGQGYVQAKITTLLQQGCRYIIFDAAHQCHLDLVAELGLTVFSGIILAGSAGLAAGVAKKIWSGIPESTHQKKFPVRINTHILWLCGTASEKTAIQIQRLLAVGNCAELVLDAATLAGMTRQQRDQLTEDAVQLLEGASLVMHISSRHSGDLTIMSGKVLQGFALLARNLLGRQQPSCIFLSGGDTADAILQAMGVHSIRLDRELVSGIVLGHCIGGVLDQLPVVTKAGGFGTPDTLLQVLQKLS